VDQKVKRYAGFTLLEVLYCIAIIAIVAAILMPVFRSAKHSAQVTASISNLHQMYVALSLYQTAQGTGAQTGTLAEMGLPSGDRAYESLKIPSAVWRSPCGLNTSWAPGPVVNVQYEYFAQTSFTKWDEAIKTYQDNVVMFVDMNCSEHGEPLRSTFIVHQGLGVRLSGALLNLHKPGNYGQQSWWAQ
jgi:prepilin-type N-terminal cleavage/methylation domain-containing protein